MKTIEYKGKVYEIGKYYLFGDDEDYIDVYEKLINIDHNEDKAHPFKSESCSWRYTKELPSSDNFGTITVKPVALEDGAAYTFYELIVKKTAVAFYNKENDIFVPTLSGKDGISVKGCTNIRKMGVIEQ